MVILDRLPTKDRMQRLGIITNDLCMFCSEATENRNHLFTECPKSASIWKSILQLSGLNRQFSDWTNLLEWATSTWKGKSLLSCILKMSWNAFNYTIWEERNRRIFKGICRAEADIIKTIKEMFAAIFG
ncbi:uncharacterized protein LOC120120047 [Hibiscus syriacus]|uniref:uncharacterized protein LOC120120047 n=1 Tax=Hibiscus syriacus TaxID=106335 RepID=UPI001920FEFF|nr:uncharacterized protein LOC120120047 [Hibiscus syriacus]